MENRFKKRLIHLGYTFYESPSLLVNHVKKPLLIRLDLHENSRDILRLALRREIRMTASLRSRLWGQA
jgi:hypothetical protein